MEGEGGRYVGIRDEHKSREGGGGGVRMIVEGRAQQVDSRRPPFSSVLEGHYRRSPVVAALTLTHTQSRHLGARHCLQGCLRRGGGGGVEV